MTRVSGPRLALLLAVLAATAACDFGSNGSPTAPDQSNVAYSQTDLTVGTGAEATPGMTATVRYGGWLYDESAADHKGRQFAADTLVFVLGAGTIIKGFDTAVTGMRVGGTRRATVPPSLAFGSTGNGNAGIPPNAALVIEILLEDVQ
jgi:FKBP-type peptidyl-prolyl cis-trans isomerase FkpA